MALREGSQGLSIKGKTESFLRELWGVVGQASGLPPGFGVSVDLGSTDFLLCQACTRGLGALQMSHIPVPNIAAPSFFFFPLCRTLCSPGWSQTPNAVASTRWNNRPELPTSGLGISFTSCLTKTVINRCSVNSVVISGGGFPECRAGPSPQVKGGIWVMSSDI